MIDIRLRKGVTGGDEFIHYIQDVDSANLENVLANALPQIVDKMNLELINMGFRFDFKLAKNQELIEEPFHILKKETPPQQLEGFISKFGNTLANFMKQYVPGVWEFFQEVQAEQRLKIMEGYPFSIEHPKLDITQDVTCLVNYSGQNFYQFAAIKIEEYLRKHFPGMKVVRSKLPEKENMIDIRLRKGVSGGDEFIHYIEDVENNELEQVLVKDLPKMVDKINLELINMGFRFNFDVAKHQEKLESPFHKANIQIQQSK